MTDSRVRTVELHLLRHGPSHNQLLSPLTDYLALCGDHPSTTLNFPLEHEQLTIRLNALRYEGNEANLGAQIREMAGMLGDVLAKVPGLISELGRYQDSDEDYVHLSIATSAAELALVPLEIANSPAGFPGSGGFLCLQSDFPVCLTRRSRSVRCSPAPWSAYPRLLMIASDAGGPIPTESHYAILRKHVDPWVKKTPSNPAVKLHERLVLLTDASAKTIEDAITGAIEDGKPFTHVHILAHGCPLPDRGESWGVALRHPNGVDVDALNGNRLGQLLGMRLRTESGAYSNESVLRPNVVSLMVCDSGNQGIDVSVPGASIAFELHEAHVPFVVGSQFPLSVGGSITLTDSLYRRLLIGRDPRECLWESRRELFAQSALKLSETSVPNRHDWCALVGFAALPENIAEESVELQRQQQIRRMRVRLSSGDASIFEREAENSFEGNAIAGFIREIVQAVEEFDTFVDENKRGGADPLLGVSAGANKRLAEFAYHRQDAFEKGMSDEFWLRPLRISLSRYESITAADRNMSWAFVQRLFVKRFLSFFETPDAVATEQQLYEQWFEAKYMCWNEESQMACDPEQRVWHLTDMVELALLFRLIPRLADESQGEDGIVEQLNNVFNADRAMEWLREMDQLARHESVRFAAYSGRRQLLRYRSFAEMLFDELGPATPYNSPRSGPRGFAIGGYEAMIIRHKGFHEIYFPIESHVRAQLDMQID